jgi:hypothetical protein
LETEGRSIPLLHDGSKYYLKIWEPTEKEMDLFPIIELTSPMPWDMQTQLASLRRSKRKLDEFSKEDIESWCERLGQIPALIAQKTLESTTQLVNSVETPSFQTQGQQEALNVDKFLLELRVLIPMLI